LKTAPLSRAMAGSLILLGFTLAGNGIHRSCSIPLPGAVIGFVLLAAALAIAHRVSAGEVKWLSDSVGPVSKLLLNHMGLLFVPAGAAIVTEGEVLRRNWIPISAALVASTLLGLAACGWIMHRFVSHRTE
jgi:holin-like protein